MSYAGPVSRVNRAPNAEPPKSDATGARVPQARPGTLRGGASSGDRGRATAFAAGIMLGVALGAGVALLFAPESGAETRRALARRGRRVTMRGRDTWDDLRDELQNAVRNRKRAWRRRRIRRQTAAAAE
jgi:hypothetical protein